MNGMLLLVTFLFLSILCGIYMLRLNSKEIDKLNEAKLKLEENTGIKFNHSYRLIRKNDKSIRYIRVFSIYPLNKEIKVKCFLTTTEGEIGIWFDKIELLYKIKDNYDLEDCGEWK